MIITDQDSSIELLCVERVPPGQRASGDVRLQVRVASHGYQGERSDIWIEAETSVLFLEQLRELETGQQDTAEVGALSSNDFWLRIQPVGANGQMAVEGRLGQDVPGSHSLRPLVQAIEFAFEISPTSLPGIRAEFQVLFQL